MRSETAPCRESTDELVGLLAAGFEGLVGVDLGGVGASSVYREQFAYGGEHAHDRRGPAPVHMPVRVTTPLTSMSAVD